MVRLLLIALVAGGCATFEDPTIVIDERVLGMAATPPEQILDIDPDHPPTIDDLLLQLKPFQVRALVAEPGRDGDLEWSMRACILDDRSSRCDEDKLKIDFARGTLGDPERNSVGNACEGSFFEPGGVVCGQLVPDNVFVQMLIQALDADPAMGLGGIDIGVELRITGAADVFAAKRIRFAARVPMERMPNNNPHVDSMLIGQGGAGFDAQKQHCNDNGGVNRVAAGEKITLFPVARDGDKEEFVLPTLDGSTEHFTEYLSYQWIATAGDFTDEETGGPPDIFGNVRLDGTEWTAPKKISSKQFVQIWVLQRDARYGLAWREACIEVDPL